MGMTQKPSQASGRLSTPKDQKKAEQIRSNGKIIVFLDINGIVNQEFFPPSQTVNQQFYLEVLKRLQKDVQRKEPPETLAIRRLVPSS